MVSLFSLLPVTNCGLEADDSPSDVRSEGQEKPNAIIEPVSLTSLHCHHVGILLSHIITEKEE